MRKARHGQSLRVKAFLAAENGRRGYRLSGAQTLQEKIFAAEHLPWNLRYREDFAITLYNCLLLYRRGEGFLWQAER
jgi:hypothetical protein